LCVHAVHPRSHHGLQLTNCCKDVPASFGGIDAGTSQSPPTHLRNKAQNEKIPRPFCHQFSFRSSFIRKLSTAFCELSIRWLRFRSCLTVIISESATVNLTARLSNIEIGCRFQCSAGAFSPASCPTFSSLKARQPNIEFGSALAKFRPAKTSPKIAVSLFGNRLVARTRDTTYKLHTRIQICIAC